MLKLKLQYFGHLMWGTDSLEKTLMLGKIEGRRRRGWQRMKCLDASPTQWTWVWSSTGSWWWTGKPGVLQSMGSQRVRHDWGTELNWPVFLHGKSHRKSYFLVVAWPVEASLQTSRAILPACMGSNPPFHTVTNYIRLRAALMTSF